MKPSVAGAAHIVTSMFAEPNLNVVNQTATRLINDPDIKPVSDKELEDMVVTLLATARASGKNITIVNRGFPHNGMGGHFPVVSIRPDFPTVRATIAETVRRKDGATPQPVVAPTQETLTPRPLKVAEVPWPGADESFLAALALDPALLPHDRLVTVTRELDRRFMQLWDKIGFERQRNLVDYSKLDAQEMPQLYPVLAQGVSSGNGYYLSVFESRYSRGTIAMLAFDMHFPLVVEDFFNGGDDDDIYIGGLLQLERYPVAAGKDVHEALLNLDKKLRGLTLTENTPAFLTWLKYVSAVNVRVKEQTVYEIVAVEAEAIIDEQLEAANASGN